MITMKEAVQRLSGCEEHARRRRLSRRNAGRNKRSFPKSIDVFKAFVTDALDPFAKMTVNDDGEFSSAALTEWYVKHFCALNYLRR